MESFIRSTLALRAARHARKAVAPQCHTTSMPAGPISIEVTTTEGKTASKEIIIPTTLVNIKSPAPSKLSLFLDSLAYHIHTIALFAYSDAKTVLIPWTLFGLVHALSAHTLGLKTSTTTWQMLARTPQIVAWIYLNLIPIDIGNQNHATAVLEDGINKPWRPLPAKRITPAQASHLQNATRIVALLFSLRYGGVSQFMVLTVLSLLYNNMGLSDTSVVARHALNGLAFISFGSGAMEVALGREFRYSSTLAVWLRIIAVIVTMGIQAADMYDQDGDRMAKRNTLPLVIGDAAARWCLAVPVLCWSVVCPWYWGLGVVGYVMPVACGVVVAKRTLTRRNVVDDKKTYKLWNLWLVVVYCLPLVKCVCAALA